MITKQYRIAITTADGGSFFSYEYAGSTHEAIILGIARLVRSIGPRREIATIAGSFHTGPVSGWISKSRWQCACKFTHDVLSPECGEHVRGQGCGARRPVIVRGSEQDYESEKRLAGTVTSVARVGEACIHPSCPGAGCVGPR